MSTAQVRAGSLQPVAIDESTLPPGLPLPAAAQIVLWMRRPVQYLNRCRKSYGDAFTMRVPGMAPIVMISHPDAIKAVFTGNGDELPAGAVNAVLEPLLGTYSTLLLDGAPHKRHRRLLMPPLHGDRMRAYADQISAITMRGSSDWQDELELLPPLQEITLNVIIETVFGVKAVSRAADLAHNINAMLTLLERPITLLPLYQHDLGKLTDWHELVEIGERVDAVLFEIIAERRKSGERGQDVLSLLLDARDEDDVPLSDFELRDELVTLLFAGHETTATALAWTLHLLSKHQDIQERAHEEAARHTDNGVIIAEQLNSMRYIHAIAQESLRLHPVVPLVGRTLQKPMRVGDRDVPKGAIVAPCIYLAHRHKSAWDRPDEFRPERFLEHKPSPFAYMPFGGGYRRCIGRAFALYEMKVVLASLLARMRFSPGSKKIRTVRRSITFAPSSGMPLRVERI